MGGDASRLGTSKNFGLKERTLRKLKYTMKKEADAVTIALLPRNACHLGALSPLKLHVSWSFSFFSEEAARVLDVEQQA